MYIPYNILNIYTYFTQKFIQFKKRKKAVASVAKKVTQWKNGPLYHQRINKNLQNCLSHTS